MQTLKDSVKVYTIVKVRVKGETLPHASAKELHGAPRRQAIAKLRLNKHDIVLANREGRLFV